MTTKLGTPQEWQDYFDSHFPFGAQYNEVLPDGTLDTVASNLPYIVVMTMEEGCPVVLGVAYGTDHAIPVYVREIKELDRDGHFIARVVTEEDGSTIELSSWLSPELEQRMLAARPDHQLNLREASVLWQRGEIAERAAEVA